MIMSNPNNARPCRWHTRDYGFMAANPFGQEVFNAGPSSKLRVGAGRPFRLAFGVLIHAGKGEDSVDFDAAYQDYVKLSRSMPISASNDK
jgi:methane monooxygenase PmoA-like